MGSVLIPYCKFQNGHPPKWGYEELKGLNPRNSRTDLIYGYCSPFYGDFSVFGQYHYHSRNKNLTFGLVDKNLNPVENAIYSSLEVYPYNSSCFIGNLNSKIIPYSALSNVFFNPNKDFWIKGEEVLPINSNLFAITNLNESTVKIFTCEGSCMYTFPFCINNKGQETKIIRDSFVFDKINNIGEFGFRLKYWNNGFEYFGDFDGEPIEEYWEQYYFIDFDKNGNLLFSGARTDFDKILNFTTDVDRPLISYPEGLEELRFIDVQQQLLADGIIDSDKIYNPVFYRASLYKYESRKFWEPQSRQFSVVATL
jgi:hypothetical protein